MSGIVSIILHSLAAFLRRKLKDLHNQGPQNRTVKQQKKNQNTWLIKKVQKSSKIIFTKTITWPPNLIFWKYLLWCPMIMKTRTMCHHSSFIALLPNPFYTLQLMNKIINALRNIRACFCCIFILVLSPFYYKPHW